MWDDCLQQLSRKKKQKRTDGEIISNNGGGKIAATSVQGNQQGQVQQGSHVQIYNQINGNMKNETQIKHVQKDDKDIFNIFEPFSPSIDGNASPRNQINNLNSINQQQTSQIHPKNQLQPQQIPQPYPIQQIQSKYHPSPLDISSTNNQQTNITNTNKYYNNLPYEVIHQQNQPQSSQHLSDKSEPKFKYQYGKVIQSFCAPQIITLAMDEQVRSSGVRIYLKRCLDRNYVGLNPEQHKEETVIVGGKNNNVDQQIIVHSLNQQANRHQIHFSPIEQQRYQSRGPTKKLQRQLTRNSDPSHIIQPNIQKIIDHQTVHQPINQKKDKSLLELALGGVETAYNNTYWDGESNMFKIPQLNNILQNRPKQRQFNTAQLFKR